MYRVISLGPLLFYLATLPILAAQNPDTPSAAAATSSPSATKPASELSSRDEMATFKVKVNVVLVRVVVRDSQGHAVGTLKKENFELFDNKKQQAITTFSVEQPGTRVAEAEKTSEIQAGSNPPSLPERFIAYLFDDIHLNNADLMRARIAANHHLDTLAATDRAGVFSTSGQTVLDFTDDRGQLRKTLSELRSRPIAEAAIKDCPDVSYYMADLIQNKHDPMAVQASTLDALGCAFGNDQKMTSAAQALVNAVTLRELSAGDHETQITLGTLKDVIRKISVMPGQRIVVLVSPGFLNVEEKQEESDLMERALHSNVMVSALDARGLYTDPSIDDASQPGRPVLSAPFLAQYRIASASANDDVMAELADGTGGAFFHNNNDLDDGFRRLATAPEYYYLLGFSPQNLKLDGRYHSLKVRLINQEKLSVQARRGYYAPKHIPDPAEQAKQEIEEALFSQEEMNDLPVDLHTQFFKIADTNAKLAVLAHLDIKRMRFRRVEDRNGQEVTVVSGLFDRNGQFITANEKILTMRLRDETLERRVQSGVTLKTNFDVKPGSYLVRLVVRDAEGEISAQNGAIEIP